MDEAVVVVFDGGITYLFPFGLHAIQSGACDLAEVDVGQPWNGLNFAGGDCFDICFANKFISFPYLVDIGRDIFPMPQPPLVENMSRQRRQYKAPWSGNRSWPKLIGILLRLVSTCCCFVGFEPPVWVSSKIPLLLWTCRDFFNKVCSSSFLMAFARSESACA